MQDVQAFVMNFPDSNQNIGEIQKFMGDRSEVLYNNAEACLGLAATLNQATHSYSTLYLLCGVMTNAKVLKTLKFPQVQRVVSQFFLNFDWQFCHHSPAKLYKLGELYSGFLLAAEKPMHGIFPLKCALLRVQTNKEQISPLHKEFAKLCLKAKCY